jgi:hypothetical protein
MRHFIEQVGKVRGKARRDECLAQGYGLRCRAWTPTRHAVFSPDGRCARLTTAARLYTLLFINASYQKMDKGADAVALLAFRDARP